MTAGHDDIGPELRRLAQVILDRLDPTMRAAAAAVSGMTSGPGRCQQVWCPVCALAALVAGEQHPLLDVVAEHSVALMTVLSAMVADAGGSGPGSAPPPPAESDAAPPAPGVRDGDAGEGGAVSSGSSGSGGYQRIPIVVEPVAAED